MIKTVFLDRDGIINEVVVRQGIDSSPRSFAEFRLRDDFVAFFETIRELPLQFFVVSNQPDVSRQKMANSVLDEIDAYLLERFPFQEIVYCRHDDNDNCACRKPKPGMILQLIEKYSVNADEAIIIGDRYKDILAGTAAGIRTILCCHSYNAHNSCKPDYTVARLAEIEALKLFRKD